MRERAFVEVIELSAYRQTVGKLRQPDREFLQSLGEVMSCRLPLERGVHGKDDFLDAAGAHTLNEAVDCEVFGTNPLQSRETPTKHMISPGKQARTIERPKVGYLLDDA